jgi:hypothetical protein
MNCESLVKENTRGVPKKDVTLVQKLMLNIYELSLAKT